MTEHERALEIAAGRGARRISRVSGSTDDLDIEEYKAAFREAICAYLAALGIDDPVALKTRAENALSAI